MLPGVPRRPQSTPRKIPNTPLLGGMLSAHRRPSPRKSTGRGGGMSSQQAPSKSQRQANSATQVILDRVPPLMEMGLGNSAYYIPFSVHTAKIEVEWGKHTAAVRSPHVDVEVSIAMFTWSGKRFDFVTNMRRISKDKSISFVGEDALSAFSANPPNSNSVSTPGLSARSPPSILKAVRSSVSQPGKNVTLAQAPEFTDDENEASFALGLASLPAGAVPIRDSTPRQSRQEYTSKEAYQIKLHSISSAVAFVAVVVSVKSQGKTLSDIKGPRSSIADTCYFPENPTLARYDHSMGEKNVPAVCSLLLQSEAIPKKLSGAKETAEKKPEVDDKKPTRKGSRNTTEPAVPRLWTVRSPGFPLKGRNFRQISEELEHYLAQSKDETEGGPLGKRPTEIGGDPTRVAAHRLSERAWEIERGNVSPLTARGGNNIHAGLAAIRRPSVRPPSVVPTRSGMMGLSTSALLQHRGTFTLPKDLRAASPETESSSSNGSEGEEAGDLFYVSNGQRTLHPPTGQDPTQRTRVVRKYTKSYSVGQGVRTHGSDSDFDEASDDDVASVMISRPVSASKRFARSILGSSASCFMIKSPKPPPATSPHQSGVEDEALLESVFPHYVNPQITRYEPSVYNRGSHRESLLEHYLRKKDTYDTMLAAMARTPKEPVTVRQVSNVIETEEDIEREQLLDSEALKPKLPAVMSEMIAVSNQETVHYLELLAAQQRQADPKRRPKSSRAAAASRLSKMAAAPTRPSTSSSKVVRRPPSTSFSPRNQQSSWGSRDKQVGLQWTTKPQ